MIIHSNCCGNIAQILSQSFDELSIVNKIINYIIFLYKFQKIFLFLCYNNSKQRGKIYFNELSFPSLRSLFFIISKKGKEKK